MSDTVATAVPGNTRLGDWIHRGFEAFANQWQALLVQMLIASLIALAASACLVLPVFLVLGPLSCGLHYCGLRAVRGERVDQDALVRGWTMAGRSMIAWLALQFLMLVPAMLLYMLFGGAFYAMTMSGALFAPTRPVPVATPAPVLVPARPIPVLPEAAPARSPEAPGDADPGTGSRTEPAEVNIEVVPGETGLQPPPVNAPPAAGPAAPLPRAVGPPMRMQPPLAFFAGMIVAYGFLMLGMLAMIVWQLWFATRTMYAMPLIADRGCSAMEAITESWRLTKSRFWELLVINFLACLIGFMGMYACYVGVIATLPIYFTLVAAAYEGDAHRQFVPEQESQPT